MRGTLLGAACLILLTLPGWGSTAPAAATAPSPGVASAANFTGNLSIQGLGPEADVPAGTVLSVAYELRDPTYQAGLVGLYVHVPPTQADFNVSWGVYREFLTGTTEQFNSTNWTGQTTSNLSTTLTNETVFPNTGSSARDRALLTTQGLALTSAGPPGSLTVQFRWRWILVSPTGPNFTGTWLPSNTGLSLVPGEFAQLASGGHTSVPVGQSYSACLTGSVGGRTFQLQAIIPTPHLLVGSSSASAGVGALGPLCLALAIPTWLAPQQINIYLWSIVPPPNGTGNASTYLLYSLKVQVTVAPSPSPAFFGIALSTWYQTGEVTAIGAMLLLGGYGATLVRTRRGGSPPRRGPPERG